MVPYRPPLRLLIVEDEDLFRDLLTRVLSTLPGLEVVGSFAGGEEALAVAYRLDPHVALLDIELRTELDGVHLGLKLRRQLPELGIILLSNHADLRFVGSLPPGATSGWSYLLKKSVTDIETLVRAIEGTAAGLVVLDPNLVSGAQPRTDGALARLTPRQQEVLGLIAQGMSNSAIAQQMGLAEKSVENHINLMYQNLGIEQGDPSVHHRVKAALAYLRECV